MKALEIYPKNKEHFKKLVPFAKNIIAICKDAGTNPIIYGSFAHFHHTQDKSMDVHDIDLLLPKKDFPKIFKALEKRRIKFTRCYPKDYSIIIKKGGLKVEMDIGSFPKNPFDTIDFYGIKTRVITLKKLEEIYPIAYAEAKRTKKKVARRIKSLEKFLGRKLK